VDIGGIGEEAWPVGVQGEIESICVARDVATTASEVSQLLLC
jgi:hypothetical protein